MAINYEKYANKYKPEKIVELLIGEAPPPNGKNYFYKTPENYKPKDCQIEHDSSLPSTIFHHYFQKRPVDKIMYEECLNSLKKDGVFLIDIMNEPIQIRGKRENIKKLISTDNLKMLKMRIEELVQIDTQVTFLLARTGYTRTLKQAFPNATFKSWKEFRLSKSEKYQI